MEIAMVCTPRISAITVADLMPGQAFRTVLGEPRALLLTEQSAPGLPGPLDAIETRPRRHVAIDLGTGEMVAIEANVQVVKLAPLDGVFTLVDTSGLVSPANTRVLEIVG